MTVPTNTYTRFTAGTNVREDLIDKITQTNPEKTPIISAAGKAVAENTYHEWQRDNLRTPNKDNAALDGDDATGTAKTPPGRVANYCQIFQDTIVVSGRAEKVKKAGMKSAMAFYKAKAYKEIQRDMEAMVVSSNPAIAGSAAVASKAGGLGVLLYTNAQHGVGGATVAHTSGAPLVAPTAGTARPFTEGILKSAIQATYIASGDIPDAVYLSPNHKGVFSGFTGIAVNRYQVGKKEQGRIIGGADVYASDFGEIEIVPHYIMAGSTNVFGLNPDYIDIPYLRPFQSTQLGKSGDSDREQVIVDGTVRVTSEMANFKISDLSGG
jgi:Family of unknown function (DUF5309)